MTAVRSMFSVRFMQVTACGARVVLHSIRHAAVFCSCHNRTFHGTNVPFVAFDPACWLLLATYCFKINPTCCSVLLVFQESMHSSDLSPTDHVACSLQLPGALCGCCTVLQVVIRTW